MVQHWHRETSKYIICLISFKRKRKYLLKIDTEDFFGNKMKRAVSIEYNQPFC